MTKGTSSNPKLSNYQDALPEMIKIESGSFRMGNNSSTYDDEKPVHKVNIKRFYLSKYPVTNAQFVVFLIRYGSDRVKEGPYKGRKIIYHHPWGLVNNNGQWSFANGYAHYPVINVSWFGAKAFCQWLSDQSGHKYTLPSEAQWEYAARGGIYQDNHHFIYAGSNKLKEVGWYHENSHRTTKPVGLKLPNALGLYDMSGNVYEWCEDSWHENYEDAPSDGSAWLSNEASDLRVVRGGSWDYINFICRVSFRDGYDGNFRYYNIGFRLSRY